MKRRSALRRFAPGILAMQGLLAFGCSSSSDESDPDASGGSAFTGGTSAGGWGGSSAGGAGVPTGGTEPGGVPTGGTTGGSSTGGSGGSAGLGWPIDCLLGEDCTAGYPDIDGDGVAFDCGAPGYTGHQGTDLAIGWTAMDAGTDVYAAADGEVLWVFDGNYDRCPDVSEPSCEAPTESMGPGVHSGYMVCTDASNDYCEGTQYTQGCYWCFYGSNVVVIRHPGDPVVFATRYDHLRSGSIVVAVGQQVTRGQKIAEVGSAGNSTGPHLHFEVWAGGFGQLADPWAGACGPNTGPSLWDPALGL